MRLILNIMVDFKKATTSEYAEKFFMDLLKKYILIDGDIQVKEIIRELKSFKLEIVESLKRGERTFLQDGNAKELAAYKNAEREQSIRGVLAWNILNPDNQIDLPAKVSLVKLNLITERDCEPLMKSHPDIYKKIIDKIFNDTTGMFVTATATGEFVYVSEKDSKWFEKIPKKYRTNYKKKGPAAWNEFLDSIDLDDPKYMGQQVEIKSRGLQVLAIPSNALIPEWAIPYIDYQATINNIVAPFNPVLKIFKLATLEEGKTISGVNRKSETFSNIVKF